jgi:hypothetical protein
MKLVILCLGAANRPSLISEGVAEIRINSQPCNGINLTTRHTWARREPRVATVHDAVKESGWSYLTLVPSSTRMPQRTHCGWPEHYSIVHLWSEVRYHPTHRHTKILSFGTSYIPYAPVHNQILVHSDPTDTGLNWHRRGLPPWSSEFTIQTTLNLPIQYSPFSPNFPVRSPIMPTFP